MKVQTLNLSLRQLRAFVEIARLESFTRAAEQMHISQAGLSGMLREVETQLGCRLFDRTTRHVSLTRQGKTLLPTANRVLSELEAAAASLTALSATQSHTLLIGATPLVASCVMPAVCVAFAKAQPQITVVVRDLERTAIEDGVRTGELDVGFGVFLDVTSGIRRVKLIKTPLMLVTSLISAPPHQASMRWSNVQNLPLVGLPLRNPIQQCVDAQLAKLGRGNEARATFNHLHTLLAMIEAGMGSAVLPSFISAALPLYQVRLNKLTQPRVDVEFFEITHAGRPRSDVVSEFSKLLKEMLTDRAATRVSRRACHAS